MKEGPASGQDCSPFVAERETVTLIRYIMGETAVSTGHANELSKTPNLVKVCLFLLNVTRPLSWP